MSRELSRIPIIVLCGGQGTRLCSAVRNRPKILAPLGAQTLLDLTMQMLRRAGFLRIILSVGYCKGQIKAHCKAHGYEVEFAEEQTPLGTGGALKAAAARLDAPRFCVMNGDMIFDPDFPALYRFHRAHRGVLSLALARPYEGDGGSYVEQDSRGRIVGWRDRAATDFHESATLINGGVYVMEREILHSFPARACFSLEWEVFPNMLTQPCYGFIAQSTCIDIGTPERYARALTHFSRPC